VPPLLAPVSPPAGGGVTVETAASPAPAVPDAPARPPPVPPGLDVTVDCPSPPVFPGPAPPEPPVAVPLDPDPELHPNRLKATTAASEPRHSIPRNFLIAPLSQCWIYGHVMRLRMAESVAPPIFGIVVRLPLLLWCALSDHTASSSRHFLLGQEGELSCQNNPCR
jgi:hypothetical protein